MAEQEKEEAMMDECVQKVGYFSERIGPSPAVAISCYHVRLYASVLP